MNNTADIRHWMFEEFAARLALVFETMAGERPQMEIEQVSELPTDTSLRWRQPFSGAPGAIWVAASDSAWGSAGGHVLRAAGIDESDPGSLKSTYLETINQALSGIATAMGDRAGREVSCIGGDEGAKPAPDIAWAVLRVRLGAELAILAVGLEPSLVTAMTPSSQNEALPPKGGETALAAAAGAYTGAPPNSKTFELLLDVELPVSVSFGRAQVPLKDVLKLTTGSIVELNRSILEPVEVIVNNCVIARGEVVVVEGNFGVRVHQVISRQERLRTLN